MQGLNQNEKSAKTANCMALKTDFQAYLVSETAFFFLTKNEVISKEIAPPTIILNVCQPWKTKVKATASECGI